MVPWVLLRSDRSAYEDADLYQSTWGFHEELRYRYGYEMDEQDGLDDKHCLADDDESYEDRLIALLDPLFPPKVVSPKQTHQFLDRWAAWSADLARQNMGG